MRGLKRVGWLLLVMVLTVSAAKAADADSATGFADYLFGGSASIAEPVIGLRFAAPCVAGEKTWDGEGASNNWSEAANWTCDQLPLASDRVIFDATSTKDAVININTSADDLRLGIGYTGTVSTAPGIAFSFGRNIASFFTSSQAAGNFVCGSGSTITFFKTTFTMTGGTLDCRNGSVTFDVGRVNINGGTFDAPTGTLTLQGFSSGVGSQLNLNAGGTFNHNGGTIVTSSSGGSMTGLTQPLVVNNLIFNGQTGQNLADSTVRVLGNLTLASGGQLTGAIRTDWELHGNLTVGNGSPSGSRSNNLITFAGSGDQTFINTGGLNPLATWRINKPSGQLILQSNLADFGGLELVSGKVNAGNFTVDIGANTATGGNANSYVIGKLRRNRLAAGVTHLYPVGSPNGYAPATAVFSGLTITVEAKDGVHPAMNPATSLARYWTVSQTGDANADLTFTYQDGDIIGDENLYATARINNGVQFLAPVTPAQNQLTATGETLFGDFTAGETLAPCVAGQKTWDGEGSTNNWSEAANWSCNAVPLVTDRVLFNAASHKNATIDSNVTVKTFEIDSYTGTITNASTIFSVLDSGSVGLFLQRSGTFNGGTGTINLTLCCNSVGASGFRLQGGTFISTSGTLNLDAFAGSVIDSGASFLHNNGTVNIVGTRSGSFIVGGTATDITFNNLSIQTPSNFQGGFAALARTITTNGQLNVNARTDSGSVVFRALGDATVGASSGPGASNLVFAGGANQSLSNLGGTFPFRQITVDKTGGTATANSPLPLRAANDDLLITSGTLYLASGANVTARNINIGANGRLVNDSAVTLTIGTGVVNDGVVDLQGGGAACNETPGVDPITIISSNTTQKPWTGTGVNRLVDVSVTRMGGSGTKLVFSGTSVTGNNATWVFDPNCPTPLSISPTTLTIQAGATQAFTASGGFLPRSFSIPSNNSGGTIDPVTGLYTAGPITNVTDTVRVTDAVGSTADATVSVFGVPAKLGFISQPTSAVAAQTIAPAITVAVQDAAGNTVLNSSAPVTIAISNNPNGGILSGTLTRNAVNGIATFNDISINRSGSGYTLQAQSAGLTPSTSGSFDIAVGPASRLAFTIQPTNTLSNAPIAPAVQVAITDAAGNIVPTATDPVTVSIGNNPSAGTLAGTLTRNAAGGIAAFNDLAIDNLGSGYTISAISGALTGAISDAFAVTSIIVTNTDNSGPGSLRQAIIDSNATAGRQQIAFAIPGLGPFSIAPQTNLPAIADPVTIDATTQPGFSDRPIVELNGAGIPGGFGFDVTGSDSVIKGFVINRFRLSGSIFTGAAIRITGNFNSIEGNFIGLNATGTAASSNTTGIFVEGSNNRIGGNTPAGRNVISGNSGSGIWLRGNAAFTEISGNYVGLDPAGANAISNSIGIRLLPAANSLIANNAVSGNFKGIDITGSNNRITGNIIGRNAANSATVPGQDVGISFTAPSGFLVPVQNNVVGGTSPGDSNIISGNRFGIFMLDTSGGFVKRNRISRNSIYGNESPLNAFSIGLSLGRSPTLNDVSDPDAGANNLQNFPVVSSAVTSTGLTIVNGSLNSVSNRTYTIEFFSNSTCSSSGYGEGETYLGTTTVNSGPQGSNGFNIFLPETTVGHFLTATATDPDGNTSEFSRCTVITRPPQRISGTVTNNVGQPIGGATVRAIFGNTALNQTVVTASNGSYSFQAPFGSSVTVTPEKPNFTFAPASRTLTNISAPATAQNFAGTPNATIRGTVMSTTATAPLPLSNVRITLNGNPNASVVTDINGNYTFQNLAAGTYSLAASLDGFTFTPSTQSVTLAGTDRTANFSADQLPPDGRLFFASVETSGVFGAGRLRILNRIGSTVYDATADGRRLIGSDLFNVFTTNFDGSDFRVVVSASTNTTVGAVAWSPDSSKFAYILRGASFASIRIANADGSNSVLAVAAGSGKTITSVDWSSTNRLVFSERSTTSGSTEIKTIDPNGQNSLTILTTTTQNPLPSVSPDGTQIAFVADQSPGSAAKRLMRMNIDGTGQLILVNSLPAGNTNPAWSPDGTRILLDFSNSQGASRLIFNNFNNAVTTRSITFTGSRIFWAREVESATPAGSNIGTQNGAVGVTFGTVNTAGATTITPIPPNSAGNAPGGFVIGNMAYEISTTASITPPITVCFTVPSNTTLTAFNAMSILHSEGGVLVDRTVGRDFATKQICAQTTSLSPFVLAEQIDPNLPSITGLVVDQNGAPMAGVSMALSGTEGRSATTDSDGRFAFVNLTLNGNYNVSPKQLGVLFDAYNQDFVDVTGEETVVFTGTAQTFSISGTVTNGSGAAVAGATVSIEGDASGVTTTDANGNYTFSGLPADGFFDLEATVSGSGVQGRQIVAPLTGDVTGVDFQSLVPTAANASIAGRIMTSGGNGIRNATVEISGGGLSEPRRFQTGQFGRFRFDGLPVGESYVLTVISNRYRFENPTRIVTLDDDISDADFVSIPE